MKFMKLGFKPDTFQADGNCVRYVASDLASDVTVSVGEVKFYLHKFPLLSKSNLFQRLVQKANEEKSDEIVIDDFPGGPKAFEYCAKFCYGMTVTLNAYNVAAARCAAEYLEMTEDIEKGNLVYKIEVFLNSSIFRSWKDSIIVLQTSSYLRPWSEDLRILGRCIHSIVSKALMHPANVTWSYTYSRKLQALDKIIEISEKAEIVPNDWWVEDICELDIDLFKQVIVAIKSKGGMNGSLIGEALRTYAIRWLPDSVDALISESSTKRNKFLVETIISLLPSHRAMGCSCSFLLKLLKVVVLVGVEDLSREDLVRRIALKLHEASVTDLLIPAQPPQTTIYDFELVHSIFKQYMLQKHSLDPDKDKGGMSQFILGQGSLSSVRELAEAYLAEVAHDPNLPLFSFIDMLELIPDPGRSTHDGLYRAINIYLKNHPSLTKSEKKKICGLMDVRRLSTEASMHAAQNEHLPLRVAVQVLFFEQVRANARIQAQHRYAHKASHPTTNTDEEECEKSTPDYMSCKKQMSQRQMKVEESEKNGKLLDKRSMSKNSRSGVQLLQSRSRRIFDKLWGFGKGNGESKNSETSGSSQSPTSLAPGDSKSSGSSSRHRRHSIS